MHSVRAATELGGVGMGVTIWGRSGDGAGTPYSSNGPAVPLYSKLLTWGSCCNTEYIYQTLGSKERQKKKKKKGKNFREILRGLDMGAGIGWGRTGSQLSGTTFPSLRACRAILASHPPTSLGQGCPVLKCPLILGSPIPEAQDKEERLSHSHPFHEAAGYCHRVTIAAVQVSEKLAVGGKETIRPPPL